MTVLGALASRATFTGPSAEFLLVGVEGRGKDAISRTYILGRKIEVYPIFGGPSKRTVNGMRP